MANVSEKNGQNGQSLFIAFLLVLGGVTRKYPHLVLIPALSSGRVLVLNSGTRPGTNYDPFGFWLCFMENMSK